MRPSRQQARSLKVQARLEYPDEELTAYVEQNFPEQGIANVEEARVRIFPNSQRTRFACNAKKSLAHWEIGTLQTLVSKLGYTYLDVRPEVELDAVGKVKNAVNIPLVIATRRYDPEQGKRVTEKEENPDFVAQVRFLSLLAWKESTTTLLQCTKLWKTKTPDQ